MNRTTKIPLSILFTLSLLGCDPNAAFVGTWSGATTLNAASRTVAKSGAVSIGEAPDGVLVTIQLPLPTMGSPVPSSACALPARASSGEQLDFIAHDCPALAVGGGCSVALKVATARGLLQGTGILKINGSGTVIGTGCGSPGPQTDSFSFETLVNR